MSKFSAKSKKLITIVISILMIFITMAIFYNGLVKRAEINYQKGNLNPAISQYELAGFIHRTDYVDDMLELAHYEKDAILKINNFYEEMQRVKEEISFVKDNHQIMEVTKSISQAFFQFDLLDTSYEGDISLYIRTIKNDPSYKQYKSDYLTGEAVITDKTDLRLDKLLGSITRDSVEETIDNICKMERPERALNQKFEAGSIEDRTNMRILNSKYRFIFSLVILIILAIIGLTIYVLKEISKREKINIQNQKTKEVKKEIGRISTGFRNGIIDYEDAIDELEIVDPQGLAEEDVSKAISGVRKLHISKTAYKKGMELKRFKRFDDALREFEKVIKTDINYNKALQEIDKIKGTGKSVETIKAQTIKDKKVNTKEDHVKSKELKTTQEAEIIGIRQYTDSIGTNFIAVRIRNNTKDKRIKSYQVGFVGFDDKGQQLKVGLLGGKSVGLGRASNQNILPNEEADSGGGWYIDNPKVTKLDACISQVEYYDGKEEWLNPEYDKWLNKYKTVSK